MKSMDDKERSLRLNIHLYQQFPSLQEDLYPIFELEYKSLMWKWSHKSEDIFQECRMNLHLAILYYDIWGKSPFLYKVIQACQHSSKHVNAMVGYKYNSFKHHGGLPIHIALNAPLTGEEGLGVTRVDRMLPDPRLNVEQAAIELDTFNELMDRVKSPVTDAILEFIKLEISSKKIRSKEQDQSIVDFAYKYKELIDPGASWGKSKSSYRIRQTLTWISSELRKIRKSYGIKDQKNMAYTVLKTISTSDMKAYMKIWYANHAMEMSAYYKKYNALRRRKYARRRK